MEFWRSIPDFEHYQISNLGRVKSLKRGEKILKQCKAGKGYNFVTLSKNGKSTPIKVHKIVAQVFLNHVSDGTTKLVIDHINNDKTDNRVENLQIITNRLNCSKDRVGCSSKYTGVCWYKKTSKWIAQIRINKKLKYLGLFNCELSAAVAYNKALKELLTQQKI